MAWMRCSYWLPSAIVAIILLAPAWRMVDVDTDQQQRRPAGVVVVVVPSSSLLHDYVLR
jgi:hypothetical protein